MGSSQQEMPLQEGDLQDLQIKRIMEGRQFERKFLASIPELPDTPSSIEVVKSFARSLNNRIDAIKAILTPYAKPSYIQCTFQRFLSHPDLEMKDLIPFVENLHCDLLSLEEDVERRNKTPIEPHLVDDNARAPSHSRDSEDDDKKPAKRKRKQPAEGKVVICLDSDSEAESEDTVVKKEPGSGSKRRSNPIMPSPPKKSRPTRAVQAGDKAAKKAFTKSEAVPTKQREKARTNKLVRELADFNALPAVRKKQTKERRGPAYESMYDLTEGEDDEDEEPTSTTRGGANSRVAVKQEKERIPCKDASGDRKRTSGTSQGAYTTNGDDKQPGIAASGAIQAQEERESVDAGRSSDSEPEQAFTSSRHQSGTSGDLMENCLTEEPQPENSPSEPNAADPVSTQEENEEESRVPDVSTAEAGAAMNDASNVNEQDTPSTAGGEVPELQSVAAAKSETDPPAGVANEAQAIVTPEIKAEMTRKEVKKKREVVYKKYKDRFLLDRHSLSGIARLGGGVQDTYPKPCLWNKNIWEDANAKKLNRDYPFPNHLSEAELEDGMELNMDSFSYMTYNDLWNVDAPKYAGQPFAAVTGVRRYFLTTGHAFPVFMRRSRSKRGFKTAKLLGWEYVGNYKVMTPGEDNDVFWESAENYSLANRDYIAGKILKSSKAEGGYGRLILSRWRDTITKALAKDDSPAAPLYMIEGREPTSAEKDEKRPSLAARARALNYTHEMPDEAFVTMLVRLDEYHEQLAIKFVEYDERIYDWCVGGKTGRDADGKHTKHTLREPAKAGDWYNWAEQNMLM